jgi:PHD/YefM family antitoxin component YafN of YafNO toxin-antitoxin module
MTVRENVHQLIDALPEDRLADLLDYLAELSDTDELSPETQAAIQEGLEDIRQGRTVNLGEYRRTRGL